MRSKATKRKQLPKDIPDYDKTELLFYIKMVRKHIGAKIAADKIIEEHYGSKIGSGATDNSELIALKDQLGELIEEVYENW